MPPSMRSQYYEEEVDFGALGMQDAQFATFLNASNNHINFQDPNAVKALTKAILRQDFNLTINLRDDRLCPPVPVRYNYVRWIQDIIDTTSSTYTDTYEPQRRVLGLDIGTGASAIYTLLALRTRPSWLMCATDIDSLNVTQATQNLETNSLKTRARIFQTTPSDSLIPLPILGLERLDFTMCNPPFFKSVEEMHKSVKGEGKKSKPSAVCTGSEVEMVCPGGDLGFVLRMVEESLVLREKVQWYSSMLGKLASLTEVVKKLKEVGVSNWAVCCLYAGAKTRRWAVAWSFGDMRPRNDVARSSFLAHDILPFPTEYHIPTHSKPANVVAENVHAHLSSLSLRWLYKPTVLTGVGLAVENVWSRQFRRKQMLAKQNRAQSGESEKVDEDEGSDEDENVVLGFKIRVLEVGNEISVRWLRGTDQVLWESFCGMLKRFVDGIDASGEGGSMGA